MKKPIRLGKSSGRLDRTWETIAILTGLAVSLVFAGCSGLSGNGLSNPRETLPESINDFHSHLLWGRYAEAAGYFPVEQQADFISGHNGAISDVRYTEFSVGQVNLNYEGDQAMVWVTLAWFREPNYTIQHTQLLETWRLDEETEFWFLVERSDPDTYEGDLDPGELTAFGN